MYISKSNAEIINKRREVYLHDDYLFDLTFDKDSRTLTLRLHKYFDENLVYFMKFTCVAGFKMTGCDFWGPSDDVFVFEFIHQDRQELLPELKKKAEATPYYHGVSLDDCIEVLFVFSSGDELRIVCEGIEL